MASTMTVSSLTTIVLLLMQTPSSSPITLCPADGYFDESAQMCRECTRYCAASMVMTQECREDSDVICKPRAVACPSDWFLDSRTGSCRECTKFCVKPEIMVESCRPDADAVCRKRHKKRKKVTYPAPTSTASSPEEIPYSTTERASTTAIYVKTDQLTTTPNPVSTLNSFKESQKAGIETDYTTPFEEKDSSEAFQTHRGVVLPRSNQTLSSIANASEVTAEATSGELNVHLWIVISVLVIVVVVVVTGLLVYCTGWRCVCAGKKVDEMGAAERGGLQRAPDSNQDQTVSSTDTRYHSMDPESLRSFLQSPGWGGSNATATQGTRGTEVVVIQDESTMHPGMVASSSLLQDVSSPAPGDFMSYERTVGNSYPRLIHSSSMNNIFPPLSLAQSRVTLDPGGAPVTHLDHCGDHCSGNQCGNHCSGDHRGNFNGEHYGNHYGHHVHHYCHGGCHDTMAIAHHSLQPNYHACFTSSTFSVLSGRSGFTV